MKCRIKTVLICSLILLVFNNAHAQIEFAQDQIKRLEHLILQGVDSLRVEKNHAVLDLDVDLYKAAEFHSQYLVKKGRLTHTQSTPKYRTPFDRVEAFSNQKWELVGENIAFIEVGDFLDVEGLSHQFVTNWRESKGHYENIVNSDFSHTAVYVVFDEESNRVYATQVFAKPHSDYQPKIDSLIFPHYGRINHVPKVLLEKQVWNLRKKPGFRCNAPVAKNFEENLSLAFKDGYVGLCIEDLKRFRKNFNAFFDGLVLEYVNFNTTYGCHLQQNEVYANLNNGKGLFNGEVLKPIYKWKIIQLINELEELPDSLKELCQFLKLAPVPSDMLTTNQQINLHFINKRNPCKEVRFYEFCGGPFLPETPKVPMQYTFWNDSVNIRPGRASFNFKVYYQRNKTGINNELRDSVLEYLANNNLIIKSIQVNAFASIEGSKELNDELYERRAKTLLNMFQSSQETDIHLSVKTQENWTDFYGHLHAENKEELLGLDTVDLRNYVNQNLHLFDSVLNTQRFGSVKLILGVKPNVTNEVQLNFEEYQRRFKRVGRVSATQQKQDFKRMSQLQQYFLTAIARGNQDLDTILSQMEIPPGNNEMLLDRIMFQHYMKLLDDPSLFAKLSEYLKQVKDDDLVQYNRLSLIMNNPRHIFFYKRYNEKSLRSFVSLSKKLYPDYNSELFSVAANCMSANEKMKNVLPGPKGLKTTSEVREVYEYYKERNLGVHDNFRLAGFYTVFGELKWALERLEKSIDEDELPDYFLKQYYLLKGRELLLRKDDKLYDYLTTEVLNDLEVNSWCSMFGGTCGINFQVFDDADLRSFYCDKCSEYLEEHRMDLKMEE